MLLLSQRLWCQSCLVTWKKIPYWGTGERRRYPNFLSLHTHFCFQSILVTKIGLVGSGYILHSLKKKNPKLSDSKVGGGGLSHMWNSFLMFKVQRIPPNDHMCRRHPLLPVENLFCLSLVFQVKDSDLNGFSCNVGDTKGQVKRRRHSQNIHRITLLFAILFL